MTCGVSKIVAILALIALMVMPASSARVKTSTFPVGGAIIVLSPAELGVNNIVEPASGTTALSNVIDTTGVRAMTLKFTCTQGNITVNVGTYDELGTTSLVTYSPLSAVPAATVTDLNIATEIDESSTGGTLGVKVRFPQTAIAFSFTNAAATAGNCTARLYMSFT